MIDHYDWPGGREAMLRFGPDSGPVVVVAMPLFEEANRTRAFVVAILRALADRGIAGVLPDLPATGESLVPTERMTLGDLRAAFGCVVAAIAGEGRGVQGVAIRSGSLLDTSAPLRGRWRLAPVGGAGLLRDLSRIAVAAPPGAGSPPGGGDPPIEIAGNLLSPALLAELGDARAYAGEDGTVRIVRLESDPKPADLKLAGAPLWRRSEPATDPALAALLAGDIAGWIATCAA